MMDKKYFCATSSAENKDNLIGTASGFEKLLLIEYNDQFLNDAFKESTINETVINKIEEEFLAVAGTRVLLIKKEEKDSGLNIFAIYNNYNKHSVNHFVINSYLDLLSVDYNEIFKINNYSEIFYLVCTNGKKDKCCGKFGMKIYQNLKMKGENVW